MAEVPVFFEEQAEKSVAVPTHSKLILMSVLFIILREIFTTNKSTIDKSPTIVEHLFQNVKYLPLVF